MSKKYFEKRFKSKYSLEKKNPTNRKKLSEISNLEYKTGKLLDIGCAFGFFLENADSLGFDTYGIDSSKYALGQAKKHTKARLLCLNVSKQKIPLSNIDVCVMLNTLEHLENYSFALGEVRRVLKKNGLFFIYVPTGGRWLADETHLNYFTVESLRFVLEKSGFKVIKVGEEGGRFQIILGLLRLILKGNTYFNFVPLNTGSFISCFAIKK